MTVPARSWLSTYNVSDLRPDIVAGVRWPRTCCRRRSATRRSPDCHRQPASTRASSAASSSGSSAVPVTRRSPSRPPISLLIGANLAEIAGSDPMRYAALASATALIVVRTRLRRVSCRAGAIVNFFSETVLVGLQVRRGPVPRQHAVAEALRIQRRSRWRLLGSHGPLSERPGETNPTALMLGLSALAPSAAGKTVLKNRPVRTVRGHRWHRRRRDASSRPTRCRAARRRSSRRAHAVAPAPRTRGYQRDPSARHGVLRPRRGRTTAIGRMFGAKHGYRLDATQEFLAIGVANLAAGLGSAFPISGGMSQSLVNESARRPHAALGPRGRARHVARSLRSSPVCCANLPQPVLAAIILMAVTGLIQIDTLRHIWRFSRTEFAVAMAALLGVLGSGLLNGVLLGVVFSLVLLLGRASRPRVTELGRVPGTTYFADIERHPENERIDDVLVVRNEGALLYFNVDHVRERSRRSSPRGRRHSICSSSSWATFRTSIWPASSSCSRWTTSVAHPEFSFGWLKCMDPCAKRFVVRAKNTAAGWQRQTRPWPTS